MLDWFALEYLTFQPGLKIFQSVVYNNLFMPPDRFPGKVFVYLAKTSLKIHLDDQFITMFEFIPALQLSQNTHCVWSCFLLFWKYLLTFFHLAQISPGQSSLLVDPHSFVVAMVQYFVFFNAFSSCFCVLVPELQSAILETLDWFQS